MRSSKTQSLEEPTDEDDVAVAGARQGVGRAARLAEVTGLVETAARDGLPAHELERGLWQYLLRLGHDLQAAYFALHFLQTPP